MKTFYAQEPHVDGTTLYNAGDKREVDENEVAHLITLGVLGDKPPRVAKPGKAETNPANKAEGAADENRAEGAADANKAT